MIFSIIICAYNSEKGISKTLESILAQNFKDYEVIIIDGKSTDNTIDIIKKYEKKFNGKLKWISEKDKGIYNAMNKGIKMAQADFINIIGSGDWYEEDVFEKTYFYIKRYLNLHVFYGKTFIWDKNLKKKRIMQTFPDVLSIQPMQHPAIFYKKKLHEKFGLYDESYKIVSDYLFCLKAFYFGKIDVKSMNFVVSNFVTDGISSVEKVNCFKENIRARKEMGIKINCFRNFFIHLKFKVKNVCKK